MNINASPIFIGAYLSSEVNNKNIIDDLVESGIELPDEEIDTLINAISTNVMAKFPDGFQGGREHNNPDVFKLYTTRHHQKIKKEAD